MRLSDLQEKDIVNINDGKNVGRIIDAEIDEAGIIKYLIIDSKKSRRNIFSSYGELTITFDKIKRIGTDVILVDLWYNIVGEIKWIKGFVLLLLVYLL